MHFPWLREDEIELKAEQLRARALGMSCAETPKVDLETLLYDYLCERENMSFDDECDLGSENGDVILGRMYPRRGRIELSRSLKMPGTDGRYRFTLAHEIGHWELHRPLYLAQAEELDLFAEAGAVECLTSLNRAIFPSPGRAVAPEEWQANRFAAALLIQPVVLRLEFESRFGLAPVAWRTPEWESRSESLRQHAVRLAVQVRNGFEPLFRAFGVSRETMAIALERGKFVTENQPLL
ncbi:MAG: ImmA/IrrE family metallo-endopeptidase [Gemmatimonadota bacterium]